MAGIGSPEAAGGGPGPQGEELSPAEVEEILRELQQRLQAGEVPEEMLRDLGMNRDRLREIVERCLKDAHGRDGPPETAQAGEAPAVAGEILSARGDTAPDVTVESAAAEGRKDDLRARFEDASDRISRRYLDAVNAYYKRLSEER
jgi:hypothetical protein